ncbi:MAG TPA: PilZ domain-containing protein [Pyrinomonadaceae bacterium]|nr:PilZ domain-containing protein [Pyrinomonadaceae bacterium]
MNYDRRQAPRIDVNMPVTWEGAFERCEASITSLSLNGCFVLSGGRVNPKELVRLEIQLPNDDPVNVWGEVVDQAYEIGFAAKFTSPSDDEDQARLLRFITRGLEGQDSQD